MKAYLDYNKPFYNRFECNPKWKWPKGVFLYFGLGVGWERYNFSYPSEGNFFYPKTDKEGRHLFVIHIVILYWRVSINFYKPNLIENKC